MSGRWKPAVTGSSSAALAAASAQGNWVPSPPLWQVKDLTDFPKGEEEPPLLPLTPPPPRGPGRVNYRLCMHCHPP